MFDDGYEGEGIVVGSGNSLEMVKEMCTEQSMKPGHVTQLLAVWNLTRRTLAAQSSTAMVAKPNNVLSLLWLRSPASATKLSVPSGV